MHNDSKMISASEVNRYCYCNYQWYYERVYGLSYLRKLKARENVNYGSDYSEGNFKRGNEFHNSYLQKYKRRKIFKFFIMCIFAVAVVFVIAYFFGDYAEIFFARLYEMLSSFN